LQDIREWIKSGQVGNFAGGSFRSGLLVAFPPEVGVLGGADGRAVRALEIPDCDPQTGQVPQWQDGEAEHLLFVPGGEDSDQVG